MSEELKRLSDLIDVPPAERTKHELRILEALMANAIREKDWVGALKIFETAHTILQRGAKK